MLVDRFGNRAGIGAGTLKVLLAALFLCVIGGAVESKGVDFPALRQAMVEEIADDARSTVSYIEKEALDERVMQAMGRVPRHEFAPEDQIAYAYENRPLAIGYGQTISQPYIVALMTDLAQVEASDRVLEIGTGSGYQAAILGRLADQVYTIEIIEQLGEQAAQRFASLGYANIESRVGDGYYGWEEHAPFDAIIVTAAAGQVPPPLIRQLKPGGRMVIPVGGAFQVQQLMLVEKTEDDKLKTRQVLPVLFVPLTGEH